VLRHGQDRSASGGAATIGARPGRP
jgi:hypothetical protein